MILNGTTEKPGTHDLVAQASTYLSDQNETQSAWKQTLLGISGKNPAEALRLLGGIQPPITMKGFGDFYDLVQKLKGHIWDSEVKAGSITNLIEKNDDVWTLMNPCEEKLPPILKISSRAQVIKPYTTPAGINYGSVDYIRPKNILPVQDIVSEKKIAEWREFFRDGDNRFIGLPWISLSPKGRSVVEDGHHRVFAAMLEGASHVLVHRKKTVTHVHSSWNLMRIIPHEEFEAEEQKLQGEWDMGYFMTPMAHDAIDFQRYDGPLRTRRSTINRGFNKSLGSLPSRLKL